MNCISVDMMLLDLMIFLFIFLLSEILIVKMQPRPNDYPNISGSGGGVLCNLK